VAKYCVGPAMAVDWGDDETPVKVSRGLLARVFGYFSPYWRQGLLVAACIAAEAVLGLAPAVVFRALIDYLGHPHGQLGHVLLLVAAGVGAALGGGLIGVADSYLTTVISEGIVFTLRKQVFENLLDQSVGWFTRSRSGELMSRLSNDIDAVDEVVTDTVFGLLRNLFTAAATLVLMVRYTWQLTLLVLVLIPLVSLPARKAGRASYRARTRTQGKLAEMTAYLQEILGISGILLVKAFVRGRAERERFGQLNDQVRRLQIRQEMITRWFGMLMTVFQATGPALIMGFGGWLVLTGRTTVGTVFVFATILGGRLMGSLSSLASMYVNVTGSLAVFRRLFEYIDLPPQVSDAPGARDLGEVSGAITFDGVTFAYPGAARPALDGVTAEIAAGQLAALVGPSGAGKTTFTTLVPRFADPQAGRVLIDGHDLRSLTLESVGRQVGVVFQDTFLFHASLASNLRYARPDATDAELTAAAKAAYLHEFAASLPDGYDTIVGERGHRLSGGEKQRVAIARAILKDPRILILDEATSHLDSVSEQLIQAALQPLLRGRTSLVIAHRLSTVLSADVILVMDHGRLVAHGSHADLLQDGGLYATLYEQQFLAHGQLPSRETALT
jgi:ATP-binding cassette subfamily B protein